MKICGKFFVLLAHSLISTRLFCEVGLELNPIYQKQIIVRKKFVDYPKCRPSCHSDFWFGHKMFIWYILRYYEYL